MNRCGNSQNKAQGQFTIIDYNDALTLTGYIGSSHAKTQMYNPDNGTYTPDWSKTNVVLTPSLYVIGTTTDQITSASVTSVKWYIGSNTTAITSSGNYALSGTKSHILTIKGNTMAGLPGIDYRCVITYKDSSTGLSITHPLTISFSRVVNGSGITDLLVTTPSGNVFKNTEVASLTAKAELWRGSTVDTTNVTYKWAIMDSSVTSTTSSGYGQLWVNTATVPPETMVWDGQGWGVQNNLEDLRETVSTHTTRFGEFQSSVDGLNSYVSTMTETVEKLEGSVSGEQEKVLEMQAQISELEHTVDGLSVTLQEQFAGGINYIKNSAGLNGITDDWSTTGTVATDSSTDVQNNTTSDSCFVLGDTSTLKQVITGAVTGTSYTISLRAKKTGASYSSYFYVQYNGNTQKNRLKYVQYRYKLTSASSYGSYTSILASVTQSGTSFSFSNLELCSLDANSSYDFHLYIRDQLNTLSSLSLYFTIPQGTPLVALRKKKVGINTPTPEAALHVVGDTILDGVVTAGAVTATSLSSTLPVANVSGTLPISKGGTGATV